MRIREEDLPLRLVGRIVRPEDLEFLRSLITDNPGSNRTELAYQVCRAWSWSKPNGTPRVINARLLLLKLHDCGLLKLPTDGDPLGTKSRRTTSSPKHTPKRTRPERAKKPVRIREEDLPLRLVGRMVRPEDLEFLRSFIAANPSLNRTQLANEVCRIWSWNKPNGTPKTISASQLLLKLHDSGLLGLPPALYPSGNHRKLILRTAAGEPRPTMHLDLSELLPLQLQRVVTQADRNLWRELIDRYHYLGFNRGAGAQIRYLVHSPQGIVALFSFGASAWHVKDRDQWIGWNEEQQYQFRHLVVNNSRFLILPCDRAANYIRHEQ